MPLWQGWFGDCLLRDRISMAPRFDESLLCSRNAIYNIYIYIHGIYLCRKFISIYVYIYMYPANVNIDNDRARPVNFLLIMTLQWHCILESDPCDGHWSHMYGVWRSKSPLACAWHMGGWAWSDPRPNLPAPLVWTEDRGRNMSEVVACILAYVVCLVCGWDAGCAGNRERVDPESHHIILSHPDGMTSQRLRQWIFPNKDPKPHPKD